MTVTFIVQFLIMVAVLASTLFVPRINYYVSVLETAVHELGHSVSAFLTGNWFSPIKLNNIHNTVKTNSYGSASNSGSRWTFPGIVFSSLLGYSFPIIVAVWLMSAFLMGWRPGISYTFSAITVLLFFYGRSLFTFGFVAIFTLLVTFPVVIVAPVLRMPEIVDTYAFVIAAILLYKGIGSYISSAIAVYRKGGREGGTDYHILADTFKWTTAAFWCTFNTVALAGFLVGFAMLLDSWNTFR
jgi:hypothetical protein